MVLVFLGLASGDEVDDGHVVELDAQVGVSEGLQLVVPFGPVEEEAVDVAPVVGRVVHLLQEVKAEVDVVEGGVVLVGEESTRLPSWSSAAGWR